MATVRAWSSTLTSLIGPAGLRTDGRGVPVAVNTVRGATSSLLPLVPDGSRLASITSNPPASERRIRVSNASVGPNGILLEQLAVRVADREWSIPMGEVNGLSETGRELAEVACGRAAGGVIVDPGR